MIVIGSVTSDFQLAFVKGRQILDDIVIADEVVDNAKYKMSLFDLKLIFKKICDFVEWEYLDVVMLKMIFSNQVKIVDDGVCQMNNSVNVSQWPDC